MLLCASLGIGPTLFFFLRWHPSVRKLTSLAYLYSYVHTETQGAFVSMHIYLGVSSTQHSGDLTQSLFIRFLSLLPQAAVLCTVLRSAFRIFVFWQLKQF